MPNAQNGTISVGDDLKGTTWKIIDHPTLASSFGLFEHLPVVITDGEYVIESNRTPPYAISLYLDKDDISFVRSGSFPRFVYYQNAWKYMPGASVFNTCSSPLLITFFDSYTWREAFSNIFEPYVPPVTPTTYDLSTSPYDWSIGSHSLTFVSQASGYRDADPSSPALTFTVYAVNLTATNGTLSPAITKIAPWETKTVTLTADTGYSVPASVVTPTGVTYTKTSSTTATIVIDGSLVAAAITLPLVCVNKLDTPTGVEATGTVVSFNPVENAESYYIYADGSQIGTFTPSGPTPSMPSKGDLIEMDLGAPTPAAGITDTYRVLSVNGNIAEVVAMFDANTSAKFDSGNTNTYASKTLDTYLNSTWYSQLSATAKAAIQDSTITQYQYPVGTYDANTHASYADYANRSAKATGLTRKVYAMDVDDIEKYFGGTDAGGTPVPGTFSTADIWTLFWNTDSQPENYTNLWLRSAYSVNSNSAFRVNGNYGIVNYGIAIDGFAARPAFQIDLSKITWTPSN